MDHRSLPPPRRGLLRGLLRPERPDRSGQCVPAALCDVVPDCSHCPPETVCVQNIDQGPVGSPRCEPIPAVCGGVVDCPCVGPFVCPDEFPSCAPGNGIVECQCVNC